MSEPRRAPDDLLKEWGRQVLPVEDADVADERRARMVSRIASTVRETASERLRSSRRARVMLALVAAVLLLVTGVLASATRARSPSSSGAVMSAGKPEIDDGAARARVKQGESPSAQLPAPPSVSTPNETDEPAEPVQPKTKRIAVREPAPETTPTIAATDLAEQNRLFAAARAATKRGDDRTALGQLDQLLARWPQSPLAPEARVERFRALKRIGDRAEAAREARRYLLEQKDGPARQEARDLALDPNQSLH